MQNVFVWNGYGSTSVYPGDTKEDVLAIMREWNKVNIAVGDEPHDLEKLSERIDRIGVEEIRKRINITVYEIAKQSDDDRFDYGSGFVTITMLETHNL